MAEPNPEFLVCAICERTILRGERATDYVNGEGETVQVCELCKSRAEASGWVPGAFSATVSRQAPERRRARVGNALREVLAWRAEAASDAQPAPEPEPQPEPEPEEPAAEPEPEPEPEEVRTPLEVFNSTGEPRKIAGLVRSLGEPRVSVRQQGASTALIVVAWDLSWYRWRVRGEQVSELAKGDEISELPVEEREWNASVAEDGTLSLD